jgi:deoxyribodipyrimidine photo-lyase
MNIFVFHSDLRLQDNNGLHESLKTAKTIPVFIFTPEQLGNSNKYKSQNAVNFMCESLKDLDSELRKHGSKLHTYFGNSATVIGKIIRSSDIVAVYSNFGYTPFAKKRDSEIARICKKHEVEFHQFHDYGLLPIKEVMTSGGVYKKFTPYYLAAKSKKIPKPAKYPLTNLGKIRNTDIPLARFYKKPSKIVEKELKAGGRKNGLAILGRDFSKYGKTRNTLHINSTQLSAYIKFGCLSMREVYHSVSSTELVKQLFWREFFMNIIEEYPHIISSAHGHRNFNPKYDKISWNRKSDIWFRRWCDGQTGYPIVDAAMRQLNQIGWMHNRGRLITAAFLVKLLGYHWELGERYFATKLRDYDPAQNNGGWQFVAGSGVDAQPYFRMFNPWLQSAKYDPDAEYIKKWCPELAKVSPSDIHKWYDTYPDHKDIDYPKPMVDYEESRDEIKKIYSKLY